MTTTPEPPADTIARPTASEITDDELDALRADLARVKHLLGSALAVSAAATAERDRARRIAVALENELAAARDARLAALENLAEALKVTAATGAERDALRDTLNRERRAAGYHKAALDEVRDELTAAGRGRAEVTDWPDVLPALCDLIAERNRLTHAARYCLRESNNPRSATVDRYDIALLLIDAMREALTAALGGDPAQPSASTPANLPNVPCGPLFQPHAVHTWQPFPGAPHALCLGSQAAFGAPTEADA